LSVVDEWASAKRRARAFDLTSENRNALGDRPEASG
jgi:hypothetical protein